VLRRDLPTLEYSTKKVNEETKKKLVDLIRDLANKQNKKIYVGLVGYPNTGKTSVANSLKSILNVHKSNALIGSNEVTLDKNVVLLDRSGCIFSKNETGTLMPKSCKNVDDVKNPLEINKMLLNLFSQDKLCELYEIPEFNNITEFLQNIANKYKFNLKVILYNSRKQFQILKEQADRLSKI
jgi:nuclear GTP-binding protein